MHIKDESRADFFNGVLLIIKSILQFNKNSSNEFGTILLSTASKGKSAWRTTTKCFHPKNLDASYLHQLRKIFYLLNACSTSAEAVVATWLICISSIQSLFIHRSLNEA